jgi:SAM-dependent methyltransferase
LAATAAELAVKRLVEILSVPCAGCGSTDIELLLSPHEMEGEREWLRSFYEVRQPRSEHMEDHSEFTQGEPTFLVRCCACGTLRRNPQPTPEALTRKYTMDCYGEDTLQALLDSQLGFFQTRAHNVAGMIPRGSHILEVGSFVGAFLIATRDQGWEAIGMDVGLETCTFMRKLGLKVELGDILKAQRWAPFQAIFVWNTFDQLSDPIAFLEAARSQMEAGGLLVLRVPNGDFEWASLEARRQPGLKERVLVAQAYNNFLTFPYLNGYTRDSIAALLKRHGFRVEGLRGDVLVPVSTPDTRPWAVEEERRSKRSTLRFCLREQVRRGKFLYPWMEIYARLV